MSVSANTRKEREWREIHNHNDKKGRSKDKGKSVSPVPELAK